jgi:molecular chaperone GrpE (heat shock protein)
MVVVTALVGQEDHTITLGDSENPPPAFTEITIALKDGKGTFGIDTAKARGIRFDVVSGTPKISCGADKMATKAWYRIDAPVSCTVRAAANASVNVNVLEQPAKSIIQLPPKKQPGIVQIKVPKDLAESTATILLSFEGPTALATDPKVVAPRKQPPAANEPVPADGSARPAVTLALPYITLAIALCALLVGGMSLFRRTSAAAEKNGADDGSAAITDDRFRTFSADLTGLQTQIQRTNARQDTISADISTRASQQDMAALKQMLDQRMKGLDDALSSLQSSQNGTLKHLNQNLTALRSELQRHSEALDQISGGASEKLVALLSALPQDYLTTGTGQDTAKLLDLAVSDFFAQPVPSRDGLKQNKERTQALERAIGNLHDQIAPQFPDSTERLKPFLDQARQLLSEIDDLLQISGTNRMRLRFEVEFYASKANREGLISGIATGIKNQIQKVEKPIEYFDRRFRALAAAAAQTASDFLDANVDLKRCDTRIQGLLQDVLSAASLEQIAPAPNDEFRAAEHAVVQVMPRPGGAGGAPSVARLVSRGFRQGSQIVRKASVILYE